MGFSLSPSVDVTEKDLSTSVANLPASKTAMVIKADYGPAMKIVGITSPTVLEQKFGTPDNNNYKEWFNAWNFLQYASSLYCVRPINVDEAANAAIAVSGGAPYSDYSDPKNPVGGSVCAAEGTYDFGLYNEDAAEMFLSTKSFGTVPKSLIVVENGDIVRLAKVGMEQKQIVRVGNDFHVESDQGAKIASCTETDGKIDGLTFDEDAIKALGFESVDIPITDPATTKRIVAQFNPKLLFYNRYVSSNQDIAVAVGSHPDCWKQPIFKGAGISFNSLFDFEPEWQDGQFLVVVLKKNNSGDYETVENHLCSYKKFAEGGKDAFNNNIFVEDKLYSSSKYLYAKVSATGEKVSTTATAMLAFHHSSAETIYPRGTDVFPGADYSGVFAPADVQNACYLFNDPDSFDINILVNPSEKDDANIMGNIAVGRKDCIAIAGPYDHANIVGKSNGDANEFIIKTWGATQSGTLFNTFNTYTATYGNMKYQYDKYNDVNRWLPVLGDVAGLMAETDKTLDPWWAVAGLSRGKIRNAIKLAYNPNKTHRDELYTNAINPIMSVNGEGAAIIWGQKTATAKPSAFNRLNVRRLMITIEKAVATSARYFLFEFNDAFTRGQFKGMVDPYLEGVKSRRGLYDFLTICDESNNTPEVIDQNGLIFDIYCKPTKVAEFIKINAVVVKTGASFSEAVGA